MAVPKFLPLGGKALCLPHGQYATKKPCVCCVPWNSEAWYPHPPISTVISKSQRGHLWFPNRFAPVGMDSFPCLFQGQAGKKVVCRVSPGGLQVPSVERIGKMITWCRKVMILFNDASKGLLSGSCFMLFFLAVQYLFCEICWVVCAESRLFFSTRANWELWSRNCHWHYPRPSYKTIDRGMNASTYHGCWLPI